MNYDEIDCSDKTVAKYVEQLKYLESLPQTETVRDAVSWRRKLLNAAINSAEAEKRQKQNAETDAEHVKEVTSMELPLDWQNAFEGDERAQGKFAESISDALVMCLTELGRVDIEYIAAISHEDCKTVITTLKGAIFQNPKKWNEKFYCGWETADEYLSGNLVQKWREAYAANKAYNGYFNDNLAALKKILRSVVTTDNIYITLGSPWVPADVIDAFIEHIFGQRGRIWQILLTNPDKLRTVHDDATGSWEISDKSFYSASVASTEIYGTPKMPAAYILERTLNMRSVTVYTEVKTDAVKSGIKRVVDREQTLLAIEKQKKLIEEFQRWVWSDEERKKRLIKIYESKYGYYHSRNFNGEFLDFPGMSISLFPYQKNAVARILFTPNTLLAHDVGAGKTYVMVAAGMEMRRMGLSKKNLYVVPNNIAEQWHALFLKLYPKANVFVVSPTLFTKEKRNVTLSEMRDGDFDGIIIPYSCFTQIPLSRQYYVDKIKEEIRQVCAKNGKSTVESRAKKKKLEEQLKDAVAEQNDADSVFFDELGITRMFVDEAHNFKNVPLETKIDNVLGISSGGSKKCADMLDKVRVVQRQNDGGGIVFATGTPITNSVTDAYVMQLYLQSGALSLLNLKNFDSWVGMFAERTTEFEVDVDTNSYRLATRFAKFHNLTELTSLLAQIADFHVVDKSDGLPNFDGYTDILVPKTEGFSDYLKLISARAESVRSGAVSRKIDNMLKITTDGRKAALDLRLVEPTAQFTLDSKVARCAQKVYEFYLRFQNECATQLVFCDTSAPKKAFNIYDELKNLLAVLGMPKERVAFIHDATTEKQRLSLFSKMQRGEISVLVGSTFKLGLGVNVQDRLVALHHLDVPWRPADMTQREGRILRQGNTNEKVFIFRYITEGSFDAYSWQLLETKQRFICNLLAGSLAEQTSDNIDEIVLNYAEVKALAVGNPLVKKRVETANELDRLKILQKTLISSRIALSGELSELAGKIEEQQTLAGQCADDLAFLAENSFSYTKEERVALRDIIHSAVIDNVLSSEEKLLLPYRGFDIVLPKNMTKEKPFVWLKRSGRYSVDMGDSKLGALIRIDNFLDGFALYSQSRQLKLEKLLDRKFGIERELAKNENYTDKIQDCQHRLDEIDKKLGVK